MQPLLFWTLSHVIADIGWLWAAEIGVFTGLWLSFAADRR